MTRDEDVLVDGDVSDAGRILCIHVSVAMERWRSGKDGCDRAECQSSEEGGRKQGTRALVMG